MRFSILVPVYNVEEYLGTCIESVLNQDFDDYELILVDDGSTDNSGKICDEYCAKHSDVITVIHKPNEGLLMARRTGIRASSGDFLIFLDSDDYLFEGALSTIHETIEKHNCDMVLYNYYKEQTSSVIHLIPGVEEQVFSGADKMELYRKILTGAYMNAMWIRAVKHNAVDVEKDYSDYSRITIGEDVLQCLPLYTNAEKIVYIDKSLVFYRRNKNGMTVRWKADYFYSFQMYQRVVQQYMKAWRIDAEVQKEYFCQTVKTICDYLEYAYKENKTRKGKFYEIGNAVLKDENFMEIVVEYGHQCKQPKHRVYSKLIQKKSRFLLFVFTGIVVRVINMKTKSKK